MASFIRIVAKWLEGVMEERVLEALRAIFAAAVEAVGESRARAVCDEVCRSRSGRPLGDVLEANFGRRSDPPPPPDTIPTGFGRPETE